MVKLHQNLLNLPVVGDSIFLVRRMGRRFNSIYLWKPSPTHYLLDAQLAGQILWILVKTPFDNIGYSSSFS